VCRTANFLRGAGHWELAYDGATRDRNGMGNKLTMEMPDHTVQFLPVEC
jgi:hypothetical protein